MKRATKSNVPQKVYSTRSKSNNQEITATDKPKGAENSETLGKVDLSQFKLESKQKIKVGTTSRKQPVKRGHVPVEYDEISPSKIQKESLDSSGENSNSIKTQQNVSKLVEQSLTKKMPPNWEQVLKNLQQMRINRDAPVDSMGCDQCQDTEASLKEQRFQVLLSLMLSSQTKDQVTHAAMLRLREYGCTLDNIANISDTELNMLIYPVSFWKTKVKNIKSTALIIRDNCNGEIPKTVEDLCKLPGVGPKMAHLCMKTAWGQITGIGVDTHVHRITNRLGWVKTKTPEKTREELEDWLPFNLWSEVNHLLVGFGQQTCMAVKPRCTTCLNNQLCPFGRKEVRSAGKKVKK